MNKKEFISLIEQPEILGKTHVNALKHIADDFPYFQSAQIMLTKALYNEHHYEFEKHLKHTSLMVPDRTLLFHYIHNFTEKAIASGLSPVEIQTATIDTTETIETPFVQPEQIAETIAEELTNSEEVLGEDQPITPTVEIIQTIALESFEEYPSVIIPEPLTPETKTTESHSFSEWLMLQQGQKKVTKVQTEVVSEPTIGMIEDSTRLVEPIITPASLKPSIEEEIAQQVERSNVNEFESILDKFIRENPRISRGKAEFYNPMNMAKQSVEDNDELVTETLANVYYKQGHYKKAIRTYEKLCLIYPHKMTYFASLIQKIKTENKD